MPRHTRYVEDGGRIFPRDLMEATDPRPPKYECGFCEDRGYRYEQTDAERFDVKVPCYSCRRYCKECKDWRRKDHKHDETV